MCPPAKSSAGSISIAEKRRTDGTGHAEIKHAGAVHTVKKCRRLGVGVGGFDGENTGLSTSLIPRPPAALRVGPVGQLAVIAGAGVRACARSQPHLTRQMTAVSPNNVVRLALPSSWGYSPGCSPPLVAPLVRGARKATVSRPRQRAPALLSIARRCLPAAERVIRIAPPSSTERERAPVDASAGLQLLRSLSPLLPQAAIDRTPYFPGAPHPLFSLGSCSPDLRSRPGA